MQLELAPAEIALVYRQGLARGAEVCRYGSQEWRPLLITPELRSALSARVGPAFVSPTLSTLRSTPAVEPSQPYAISDPSLAALVLERRRASARPSLPPPPPAVVSRAPQPEHKSARPVTSDADDWAHSSTLAPVAVSISPSASAAASLGAALPPSTPQVAARAARLAWRIQHARRVELALVAAVAATLTLTATMFSERALPQSPSFTPLVALPTLGALTAAANGSGAAPAPVQRPSSLRKSFGPPSNIPIVAVHDLPVEGQGRVAPSSAVAAVPAGAAGGVAEFARALASAAEIAKICGSGPVNAQVVATFAPSGLARSVHFGSSPPPVELRSCVLNAVSRARVTPFDGAPITVSKTLRW